MKKILIYLFILAFSISFCGAVVEAQTPEQQAAARAYMKKRGNTTSLAKTEHVLSEEQLKIVNGIVYDTKTQKPATGIFKAKYDDGVSGEASLKEGRFEGKVKVIQKNGIAEFSLKNNRIYGVAKFTKGNTTAEIIFKNGKAISGYGTSKGKKKELTNEQLEAIATVMSSYSMSIEAMLKK